MSKTANKRKKVQMPAGIRNKMMAAISMLLVSTVMMVSSTYAWFTLSTAPEVTGITTNVGANGNLEMMLLTGSLDETGASVGSYYSTADDLGVVSKVGDSVAATADATVSNITWGNLVDLSDGSYGLNNITLAPARLNITKAQVDGANDTISSTILMAPSYGSDGRVIDVKTSTYTGKAAGNTFLYDDAHRGVRVIGTTTDVSQRLAGYRSAKGAVTTNSNNAKNLATASLLQNGQSLANILVGYVQDSSTTYTNADLKVLKSVLTSLEQANASAATAIKNVVLAYSLSNAQVNEDATEKTLTDAEVAALQNQVLAVTTITDISSFSNITNVLIPTGLDTAIATYVATGSKISTAMTALKNLNSDLDNSADDAGEYKYDEISPILNAIVDKTYVQIAGKANLGKSDLQLVVDEYLQTGSITMTMLDKSGVYADIAKLVGNYTVSGLKVHVDYNGTVADVPVIMQTNVSGDGIPQITTIGLASAPAESGQAANSTLSNTYGYALDFGFRTNAAASDLLLQTDAVNRVYTDQEDTTLNTQGSGSYMQFMSSDVNNFTADEVLALMSAIRVAFVTPTETGAEVLAMAALDNIVATVNEEDGTTSVTTGSTVQKVDANGNVITDDTTVASGYKAGLFLYDYTVNDKGLVVLGKQQADKSVITALTQNKASKITVIVYLDGDIVDNTMVANASTSMTGMMNIQFSSSATLAPMENTGMRTGGTTSEVITYTAVAGEGTDVTTYTIDNYTGTVKTGVTIYRGSNGSIYFSTDGGTTYSKLSATNYMAAITVSTN